MHLLNDRAKAAEGGSASTRERAEQLRVVAQTAQDASPAVAADVAELVGDDAAAVQSAWSGFVPYLAHPVMAVQARTAMAVLDAAAESLGLRVPAVV